MHSVNGKLRKFFDDVTSYRLMLRDTRAVMAGEFAHGFFVRHSMPSMLDVVFVDSQFYSGVKIRRWMRYLSIREGYDDFTRQELVRLVLRMF